MTELPFFDVSPLHDHSRSAIGGWIYDSRPFMAKTFATLAPKKVRFSYSTADQPVLQIRSDRHAKYSVLVSVLAASRRAGLNKIVIVGNEQYAN